MNPRVEVTREGDSRSLLPSVPVLMVAFHFPPIQSSSGVHRILGLARYLPNHNFQCTVLTARPGAYERSVETNYNMIPGDTRVIRTFALDAVRHLGWKGRHIRALTRPDRWFIWFLFAILHGWIVLRRQPAIIISTYPIATAHLIGWALHRLTGLPWVADFRDPMAQDAYGCRSHTYQITLKFSG